MQFIFLLTPHTNTYTVQLLIKKTDTLITNIITHKLSHKAQILAILILSMIYAAQFYRASHSFSVSLGISHCSPHAHGVQHLTPSTYTLFGRVKLKLLRET